MKEKQGDSYYNHLKEREDFEYNIGSHIYNLIRKGLIDVEQKKTYNRDHENTIVLMPLYAMPFLRHFIMSGHNRYLADFVYSKSNDMAAIEGARILPGPYANKIIVYDTRYPEIGVEPHVFEIEVSRK